MLSQQTTILRSLRTSSHPRQVSPTVAPVRDQKLTQKHLSPPQFRSSLTRHLTALCSRHRILASIDTEMIRDPEADVRVLPHDLASRLHTPHTGVRYYTNTEANRRGAQALLKMSRQRLVQDEMERQSWQCLAWGIPCRPSPV
jgi:hypothetical protein